MLHVLHVHIGFHVAVVLDDRREALPGLVLDLDLRVATQRDLVLVAAEIHAPVRTGADRPVVGHNGTEDQRLPGAVNQLFNRSAQADGSPVIGKSKGRDDEEQGGEERRHNVTSHEGARTS